MKRHEAEEATKALMESDASDDADRRSKGIGRDALRDAMNALFEKGEIINEEFGPPSHRRKRIIRKGKP
jgi:hypothetical protein